MQTNCSSAIIMHLSTLLLLCAVVRNIIYLYVFLLFLSWVFFSISFLSFCLLVEEIWFSFQKWNDSHTSKSWRHKFGSDLSTRICRLCHHCFCYKLLRKNHMQKMCENRGYKRIHQLQDYDHLYTTGFLFLCILHKHTSNTQTLAQLPRPLSFIDNSIATGKLVLNTPRKDTYCMLT